MPSVLVIGTYRQTLTVVRSLARSGEKIVLGIHGDTANCDFSRYVSEVWSHPDPKDMKEDFFVALKRFLADRDDIKTIIPVGETDIRLFMDRYAEFSSQMKLLMCEPGVINTCLDKPVMSALIDKLGIPQAPYKAACNRHSLFAAADAIGYPCIVKLADSEFLLSGRKALIFQDSRTLREKFPNWPVKNKSLIVQSYVTNKRMNVYFFALDGQIVALGQVLVLRTDKPDGTGLAVSGRTVSPDNVLIEYCTTIVRHLNYTGVGCSQFLIDEASGTATFLELNPRLGAGCVLPYRAGLDLPRIMLDYSQESATSPASPAYPCKVGVEYAWTTGDVKGLRRAIETREIGFRGAVVWSFKTMKSALTTPNHVSWDWRDPLPTIVQCVKLCGSAIRTLLPAKRL